MNKSILIVGVGGQGTLLASRILGNLMLGLDYDVKLSEVHGMAQRGGSVVTHVRYGEKVYSPMVDVGGADYILAFEKLEALRAYPYLNSEGVMIINDQKISPMPVILGASEYPQQTIKGENIKYVDAMELALQAGSVKAVNVVMLGVLSTYMDIDKQRWIDAIKATVKPKFVDMNIKAFELGSKEVQ